MEKYNPKPHSTALCINIYVIVDHKDGHMLFYFNLILLIRIFRVCAYLRNDRLNQEQEMVVSGNKDSSTNDEGTGARYHLGTYCSRLMAEMEGRHEKVRKLKF